MIANITIHLDTARVLGLMLHLNESFAPTITERRTKFLKSKGGDVATIRKDLKFIRNLTKGMMPEYCKWAGDQLARSILKENKPVSSTQPKKGTKHEFKIINGRSATGSIRNVNRKGVKPDAGSHPTTHKRPTLPQ